MKLIAFFQSLLSAVTITPTKDIGFIGASIGAHFATFFQMIGQGIMAGFYWICKWLLAIVDFLQYFIQKLIGLDYWLKPTHVTMAGATKNDLLFTFLFNDTVQKVFRAIVVVFIILLIIFTIFAIIKNEWTYITGQSFGDGKANSKSKIIRDALKAVAIVLIFPLVLSIGIISSNAILASLVNALSIDMSSTFGGKLFFVSSLSANKYKAYAQDGMETPVSDTVNFYVDSSGRYIKLGTTESPDSNVVVYSDYALYLDAINESNTQKYTVNSIFELVVPSKEPSFNGYCIALPVGDETKFYMVKVTNPARTEDPGRNVNTPEAWYYYLKCVLGVSIMNRNDSLGNKDLFNGIKGKMRSSSALLGYISGLNLVDIDNKALIDACLNTWNYNTVYQQKTDFTFATNYITLRNDGSSTSLLGKMNLDLTRARLMYNSDVTSPYFDGGQLGIVQMQAEYFAMADAVDYLANNETSLYILNATSPLIRWGAPSGTATTETDKLLQNNSDYFNGTQIWYSTIDAGRPKTWNDRGADEEHGNKYIPFVVSYSEECLEMEAGNTLYLAKEGAKSELEGAVYIMCIRLDDDNYVPLFVGKSFTSASGQTFKFTSDYYTSNYHGLVVAKGTFDTSSTNRSLGEPTYISNQNTYNDDGTVYISEDPYYYEMTKEGSVTQWIDRKEEQRFSFSVNKGSFVIAGSTGDYQFQDTKDANNNSGFIWSKTSVSNTANFRDIVEDLRITVTGTSSSGSTTATYAGQYRQSGASTFYLFRLQSGFYTILEEYTNDNGETELYILTLSQGTDQYVAERTNQSSYTGYNTIYTVHLQVDTGGSGSKTMDVDPYVDLSYSGMVGDYSAYTTLDFFEYELNGKSVSTRANVYFDGDAVSLSTDGDGATLTFGTPINDDAFIQSYGNSSVFKLYLYDYSVGAIGTPTSYELRRAGIFSESDVVLSAETEPKPTDENFIITFKIDAKDFDFVDTDLGLYDGKNYVAQVYRLRETEITDSSDLIGKSLSILYNGKMYYNILTNNCYGSQNALITHYEKVTAQYNIACTRDNANFSFWLNDFDYNPLLTFRWNIRLFYQRMDRAETSISFLLSDGISFDYFFDGVVGLRTFYIPSSINYVILVVGSILIIKVLGTALWGVIKRFYEITLYFLAMPAVASTIPLDGGSRFNAQIQQPLIQKILGTYGVILGINVFFILLVPVETMSQVFTAEDIATSGNHFLQHLPFSATILNWYVYVLFLLVAFTMINALPSLISKMLGNEGSDVLKTGAETKANAKSTMASVGKTVSGTNAVEGIKKAGNAVKNSGVGQLVGLGVKAGKGLKHFHDRHAGQDVDEDEDEEGSSSGGGGGGGTSRTGGGGGDGTELENDGAAAGGGGAGGGTGAEATTSTSTAPERSDGLTRTAEEQEYEERKSRELIEKDAHRDDILVEGFAKAGGIEGKGARMDKAVDAYFGLDDPNILAKKKERMEYQGLNMTALKAQYGTDKSDQDIVRAYLKTQLVKGSKMGDFLGDTPNGEMEAKAVAAMREGKGNGVQGGYDRAKSAILGMMTDDEKAAATDAMIYNKEGKSFMEQKFGGAGAETFYAGLQRSTSQSIKQKEKEEQQYEQNSGFVTNQMMADSIANGKQDTEVYAAALDMLKARLGSAATGSDAEIMKTAAGNGMLAGVIAEMGKTAEGSEALVDVKKNIIKAQGDLAVAPDMASMTPDERSKYLENMQTLRGRFDNYRSEETFMNILNDKGSGASLIKAKMEEEGVKTDDPKAVKKYLKNNSDALNQLIALGAAGNVNGFVDKGGHKKFWNKNNWVNVGKTAVDHVAHNKATSFINRHTIKAGLYRDANGNLQKYKSADAAKEFGTNVTNDMQAKDVVKDLKVKVAPQDFKNELEKLLSSQHAKDIVEKLYNKPSAFGNLSDKSIEIQKRAVMKALEADLAKNNKRLGKTGNYIGAGSEIIGEYAGKRYTRKGGADPKYGGRYANVGGVRVDRTGIYNSGLSHKDIAGLSAKDLESYRNLLRNSASAAAKYEAQKAIVNQLQAQLSTLNGTGLKKIRTEKLLADAKVKLNAIGAVKSSAEGKKLNFEKAYADAQIKKFKQGGGTGYNTGGDLFGRYQFPYKNGGMVRPGTADARQVEQAIRKFMASAGGINELKQIIRKNKNDFASMLRAIKEKQGELNRKRKKLEYNTNKDMKAMKAQLDKTNKQLKLITNELKQKLAEMGIDITNIKTRPY